MLDFATLLQLFALCFFSGGIVSNILERIGQKNKATTGIYANSMIAVFLVLIYMVMGFPWRMLVYILGIMFFLTFGYETERRWVRIIKKERLDKHRRKT